MSLQVRTRSLGAWPCKISVLLWIFPLIGEMYALAYLTMERTVAVCAPLFAKRYVTERISIVLPTLGIGAILAVHTVLCLMLDDLTFLPNGQNLCVITNENSVRTYTYANMVYYCTLCIAIGIGVHVLHVVCVRYVLHRAPGHHVGVFGAHQRAPPVGAAIARSALGVGLC